MKTVEDALKLGCEIRREVRFYAVTKDGVHYALQHDWTIEIVDRKLIEKAIGG